MAHGQSTRSIQAYEKYKAGLNAFFDGKTRLPSRVEAATKTQRRLSITPVFSYEIFLEAIKRSSTSDEITRTVNGLLASGHQIPQDEEILSKALIHRDQTVVMDMLDKLKMLLEQKAPKSPRLLKTRLENLLLICSSPEIRLLVQVLQNRLE